MSTKMVVDATELVAYDVPMKSPSDIPIHPAAEVFPLMEGEEFEALKKDLEEHGQREPIVLLDGMILDGRNRYRALMSMFITPKFVHWNSDGSPEAYVISKNIMRRHLTEAQRAMIGAKLANLKDGQHPDYVKENDGSRNRRPITDTEAAQMVGVGVTTLRAAKIVHKKGTPEQIEQVIEGERGAEGMAAQIRSRRTDEQERKRWEAANLKRTKKKKGMAKLWRQFQSGIDSLSALPEVKDVLNSIPANSWETYGRRTFIVRDWLNKFEEEFNASDRNKA